MPDTLDLEDMMVAHLRTRQMLEQKLRASDLPPMYAGAGEALAEGLGSVFVRSTSYKGWLERFPGGGPSSAGTFQADPVSVPGGMRALITSADASAGSLVQPDWRGLLEPGIYRPPTIRQLVMVVPTTSDLVEWVREVSHTDAAAPVEEATALTGTSGTKPEGGFTFEKVDVPIRTIAEWVPATRRVVADASGLRQYIDTSLTQQLAQELEDQMVAGDATGENFEGILNAGIQTLGTTAGLNDHDLLRRAKRMVVTTARTVPTAIVANPEDAERLDTAKATGSGDYLSGGPYGRPGVVSGSVWTMPLVETDAVPAGTAIVGDFRKAVLFDREQTTIAVGTVGDDFIRNIVRVLAEARAGFAVLRPSAFVAVTF